LSKRIWFTVTLQASVVDGQTLTTRKAPHHFLFVPYQDADDGGYFESAIVVVALSTMVLVAVFLGNHIGFICLPNCGPSRTQADGDGYNNRAAAAVPA
jgi:hypothetical protein